MSRPAAERLRDGDRIADDLTHEMAADPSPKVGSARITPFSEIEPEHVEWLDPGRVPLGGLTLIAGDPGLGKSQWTIDLAARTSRGEMIEGGADALLVSAEDSASAVIRPRLEAAEADLCRVHSLTIVGDATAGLDRGIDLPADSEKIWEAVLRHHARLVVIDPLMAHLAGGVNSWRDQSIRTALAPLHRLAEETGVAIVLVAHLNKAAGSDPIYRTGGSVGLPAAVRSGLLLTRDPDDPEGEAGSQRILSHSKSNFGKLSPSIVYRVEAATVGDGIETSRLRKLGESAYTARDLLSASGDEEGRTKTEEAEEWLRDELANGEWKPRREVAARAKSAGHSVKALRTARERLGVEDRRQGFPAVSEWCLPGVPSAVEHRAEGTTEQTRIPPSETPAVADQSCPISLEGTTGVAMDGSSIGAETSEQAAGVESASDESLGAETPTEAAGAQGGDLPPENPGPRYRPATGLARPTQPLIAALAATPATPEEEALAARLAADHPDLAS